METSTDKQEGASHERGAGDSTTNTEDLYYQHVPKLVRQGLIKKIQKEDKISGDSKQVFASVLFADISGFTQLSSRLSAEELQMHINEYFTKLLGIVEENAGDVIKFCGDAVMIMWTVPLSASDEVKAAAVLMSAVCALQMLEECGEYRRSRRDSCTTVSTYPHSSTVASPTRHRLSVSRAATQASLLTMALVAQSDSPTKNTPAPHRASHTTPQSPTNATVELSLHCGISCGTVHCMTLGDTQRLEFLISGEVISQMGAAEACAKAGEVCVHPTAFERIRNKLDGEAVYPPAAPPVKPSQAENTRCENVNNESVCADGEEMVAAGQISLNRPPPLVLGAASKAASVVDCSDDLPGSEIASFLSAEQEETFNTPYSTKSSPHAGTSARGRDGCLTATPSKQPDLSQDAPIAYLLTGRLAEEFTSSPSKQRSRRSVRIATAGSISTTTTISAGHLSERRPRRSGSIISFHLPSERIAESPSTDLESLAPTEKVDDDSLVMSDAEAEERAAEIKAQKKYALHERGLFPTDESAAILDPSLENTGSASSKALSADSAKYLEALARELTGNPTQLVRARQKITAADVVPQPVLTDDLPLEQETSVATSRHGSLLTFLRGSKIYSSTTPALSCSDTVDIQVQERTKPGVGRHSVSTSPTRTKRGSIVLNVTVSAKEVPSSGDAVGVIARAPSIQQSVHRGVQRHLSALISTTRSSLGFILPLQGAGLIGYPSSVVSESSTTAASSAHSLHDGKDSLKEGTVAEPPLTGQRQRARTASASFDEACEPNASDGKNPSSPPFTTKLDEVTTVPLNNDSAQLATSKKKLSVDKIKRKLHFSTDEHVCTVRALQEDSNKPPKRRFEDVRDFNSSDNSLSERDQSENKVISASPVSNEALELRLLQELRRFTHETASRAIDSNTVSFLSELRDVAVVFMQILDLDAEFSSGLYHKPQRVLCVILKLLRQFGGSLRQFVVDDKGCVAIGCFGLSGSSNQNNCVQAVDFAVSVRTLLHTLGCRSAVGITLGRVYCGLVGAAGRCEYAVMGASVNLAARLMAACAKTLALMVANSTQAHAKVEQELSSAHRITFPNTHHSNTPLSVRRGRSSDPAHLSEQSGVLVDAAVHELAQHQFQFLAQEPIVAKGYPEPVKVFAAVRKRALSLLSSTPVDATQETSQRSHSVKHPGAPPGCAEAGGSDAVSHRADNDAVEETKSSESICETKDLPLPLLEREKQAKEVIHHLLGLKDASRNKYTSAQNCVLIEGPAGVGCSRLLEYILSAVTASQASGSRTGHADITQVVQVVKVQCDPARQYLPYNLVRAFLFKSMGIQDEANLTASFTSTCDQPLVNTDSTHVCAASKKVECWCAARVPVAFSLVDAFKLCHPSLSLQEVLLFHHKVRVSSEKHGSAALQASQLTAYCTALCNTPVLNFLPLLNDAFGTNMRHSGAQLCCGTPLEKVMEQVSTEVHDLMVSVILQILLLCTLGCNVANAGNPPSASASASAACCVLAADELQHADAESINLISNALTCMARLSSPSCFSAAALPRGCFLATVCDNSSTLLSESVVTTTQTGVSAASLPVTKPQRQPSILPLSTCDCVEDLFSPVAIGENTLTHEQLIKELRSRAKLITVPRLSHTGVRSLVQHILGLRHWAWLVDNAHLALGTAARSAESAENSRVDNGTSIPVRSRVARTTPPRKQSIPLSASLAASPPRVPVRRGSSYHSSLAVTSSPERNERFLRTTDCVAEEVCMAMQNNVGVSHAAMAGSMSVVRTNRTRQPPRGPTHEQSIVQLLFILSQNGMPRCIIEIATSLRDAIASNAFAGIHRLSVVVRRNKLLLEVLDQLSGMEVVVLKAAAVIGATFDIPSLRAALIGMDMLRCAETVVLCGALVKLTAVGLIRSVDHSSSGSNSISSSAESVAHSATSSVLHCASAGLVAHPSGGMFEFNEGSTQLAVYDLMLEAQRALAHGAIGAHLEHSLPPEGEDVSGPEHQQRLLQIAHHYRHSNNTLKKIAVLTRLAEHYSSSHDVSNAMAAYCELISVALGMNMDDLISICTDNELSALTVLYNTFLPRAAVNTEGVAGSEDDVAAVAAQLRQQLFQDQVAVLDPSVLNKRSKKNKEYDRREHKWWSWCKSAAKGSSQKILPEKSALKPNIVKQAGLVSSLQQDTTDAQQLMDIRQELSSLPLSELYTQRRLLLRALHISTTSGDRSSSVLANNNAYRTICTTCTIAVRSEVASVGISLSEVVSWVGKLVTLSNRADQEEERIEYATLALHLTQLAAIPSIPSSAAANPLPQDHSGSAKSTHTLNTITTMHTPHALHHMHSMNTTYSAASQTGAYNIRPFSTHIPSAMDGEESEHSVQSSTHDATVCPACHSKKAEAVGVCCGWWPGGTSVHNSVKVPAAVMDAAPVVPSDSDRMSTAVDKVLAQHFSVPRLDTTHTHTHHCTVHKTALSSENAVLKALLNPVRDNTSVSDNTITIAKYLLSMGYALAVVVLLEPLTSAANDAAAAISSWALLSRAFRALGDTDNTTICARRALQVYPKASFGIALTKCEVFHMCASHLTMTGRYATAVKQLDVCVDLSFPGCHSLVDLQLSKGWCFVMSGDLVLARELVVSIQHTLSYPGGVYESGEFAEHNTIANYECSAEGERVRELTLLLDILQADSTDPLDLASNAAIKYTGDSCEGSERHRHVMSVLQSFGSAVAAVSTGEMGNQRSLLSIKAQLAYDIPTRLRPAPNISVLEWVLLQGEDIYMDGMSVSNANNTSFALLHQLCTSTHYTTLSSAVIFCMSIFSNMKDYTSRIAISTTHLAIAELNTICEILILLALSMLRCDTLVNTPATGLKPLYVVLNVQLELVLATFYERFYSTDQSTVYSRTYAAVFAYVTHLTKGIRLKPLPVRKSSILGIDAVSALVQSTTRLSRQNASVGRNVTATEQCNSNSGNSMFAHHLGSGRNSGCAGPGLDKQKVKLWKAVLTNNNVNHSSTDDMCVALVESFLSNDACLESKSEKIKGEHCVVNNVVYINPVYRQFRDVVLSQINALKM